MSENTIQISITEQEQTQIRMSLVSKIILLEKIIMNFTLIAKNDLAELYKQELKELEILKQKF
jgi:hypothetical protein